MSEFLRVRNISKYQHYKTRNGRKLIKPPWVKLYRDFWSDYDLCHTKPATRLLALFLVTYSCDFSARKFPASALSEADISKRSGLSRKEVVHGLQELLACSFLERVYTRSRKNIALEVEVEVEEEKVINRQTVARGAADPDAKNYGVEKLMSILNDAGPGTERTLRSFNLPPSSFANVHEMIQFKVNNRQEFTKGRTAYAIGALQRETQERRVPA